MSSSLDLFDGDDLDIVIDVEEAFGFKATDNELRGCETVGDLFALIEARLPSEGDAGRCATAMTFYRLRRALQPRLMVPLRPDTPVDALRSLPVRELYKIISQECGLHPPYSDMGYLGGLALIAIPVLLFSAMALGLSWWIAAPLMAASIVGYCMAPTRLPKTVKTFGDLVRLVANRSIGALAAQGARLRTREAWTAFTDILSDHTQLPKEKITRETQFF